MKARILWLIKGLGLGGAERLLANALPHIDRDAFDVEVAYYLPWKRDLVPEILAQGIRVTCFSSRFPALPRAIRQLRRLIQERSIDLVHAHLPWPGIAARIARRGAPAALVYTEHGLWERLHPITRFVNRATLSWNDLSLAVSEEVRASMPGRGANALTIRNGIDAWTLGQPSEDVDAVRIELKVPVDALVVGTVANFSPVKRHEDLIRAFAILAGLHSDAHLVLVGQFRSRDQLLRQIARESGVESRVHFVGPRPDAVRVMRAFDIYAMASASEGLPVSLLEAMAVKCPVVSTAVGGIPEVITDGREGLLCPAGDVSALSERLIRLARDGVLRENLGEAAAQRVREHYDIRIMVRNIESHYTRLIGQRKTAGAHHPLHA